MRLVLVIYVAVQVFAAETISKWHINKITVHFCIFFYIKVVVVFFLI